MSAVNCRLIYQFSCIVCYFTLNILYFQVLDVSYNNLSQDDVLTLGLLGNLKVLHLTGNNFKTLPVNMAMPYFDSDR